ncbi:MAG: tail fiber domain-containing protein [Saprospiraceae bacterium]|nr:tail fiber domain-containing protein [Saprospiraceae bacterium]
MTNHFRHSCNILWRSVRIALLCSGFLPGITFAQGVEIRSADLTVDRGDLTAGLTRQLNIQGARNLGIDPFASINLKNFDDNNANAEYIGARISSFNVPDTDGGDLRFYTKSGLLGLRMVITGEGNVGIGEDAPLSRFVIGHNLEGGDGTRLTIADSLDWSGINIGESPADRAFILWNNTSDFLKVGTKSGNTLYDNSLVIWDGKIGINNTSPYEELSIGDNLGDQEGRRLSIGDASGNAGISIGSSQTSFASLSWNNAGQFLELNTASNVIYDNTLILRQGKIGIGLTDPATKLHVKGGDITADRGDALLGVTRTLQISGARNAQGNVYARLAFRNFDSDDGATDYTGAKIESANAGPDQGDLRFFTQGSTLGERLTITSEGNVGVGQTDPDEHFVIGNNLGDQTGRNMTIGNSSGESGLNLGEDANQRVRIYWEPVFDRLMIQSRDNSSFHAPLIYQNGNLTVGGFSQPTEALVVGADIGNYPGVRMTVGATLEDSGINIGENSDDRSFLIWNRTNNYFRIGTRSGGVLYDNTLVLRNGFVGLGEDTPGYPLDMASGAHVTVGGVWTNASDRSRKRNIIPQPYGLAEVLRMQPVIYEYIADGSTSIGFIAQDMEQIIPEVVSGEEGHKGIGYGLLVSTLVHAIQEQQTLIEQQKLEISRLQVLEVRLQALEARLGMNPEE